MRIYRLWLPIAHQLHTLFCECVAIPETSFIIKEWENARTARDYTMHFVVLPHEEDRGTIPCIQGIILRFSWYYTTATSTV